MKSRFFAHRTSFNDNTKFIEVHPDGQTIFFHMKDGTFQEKGEHNKLCLDDCIRYTQTHDWVEIFDPNIPETPRKVPVEKPLEQFLNDLMEVCKTTINKSPYQNDFNSQEYIRSKIRLEAFQKIQVFMLNKNISC